MKYKKFLALALLVVVQPLFGADTFVLTRGSVFFTSGVIFDSLQPNASFSGTMVLDGNRVTQDITVSLNGATSGGSFSATITDSSNGVVTLHDDFGVTSQLILISCCNPIITLAQTPDFSEVDQWVLVSTAAAKAFSSKETGIELDALPGTGIGAGVTALGLNQ